MEHKVFLKTKLHYEIPPWANKILGQFDKNIFKSTIGKEQLHLTIEGGKISQVVEIAPFFR